MISPPPPRWLPLMARLSHGLGLAVVAASGLGAQCQAPPTAQRAQVGQTILMSSGDLPGPCAGRPVEELPVGVGSGEDGLTYTSLQDALDRAHDGDRILLAPGLYCANLTLPFKAITLGAQDPLDPPTLDGSGCIGDGGTSACSVVSLIAAALDEGAPTPELRDLILTGGQGSRRPPSTSYRHGGGLLVARGSLRIFDVRVEASSASGTGGGASFTQAIVSGDGLTVTGNQCQQDGGGVFLDRTDAHLTGLTAEGNVSPWRGGGVAVQGGDVELDGLTVRGNTSHEYGGGISAIPYVKQPGQLRLSRFIIEGNDAFVGGGMYTSALPVNLVGGRLTDNVAEEGGGGIHLDGGALSLENVTVADNLAGQEGGGILLEPPVLYRQENTILASNDAPWGSNLFSFNPVQLAMAGYALYWDPTTGHSGLDGLLPGRHAVVADPRFVGEGPGDPYQLAPGSPAIDAGETNPWCGGGGRPTEGCEDPDGSRNDLGAFGGPYAL